jgi:hypothetical protein
LSHLPDSKSICEKYGLNLADPVKWRKKENKHQQNMKKTKDRWNPTKKSRYTHRNHYFNPEDIKLKTHSAQER